MRLTLMMKENTMKNWKAGQPMSEKALSRLSLKATKRMRYMSLLFAWSVVVRNAPVRVNHEAVVSLTDYAADFFFSPQAL